MEAARIYATVTANTAPLMAGLARANAAVNSAGAAMVKRGKALSAVGTHLTHTLTVPIVAAAGASIYLAKNFEQAMEMVHTQAGAPQKEVDNLRGKVLELAHSLKQSPQELAQGLYHIESVGMRGAKALNTLKTAAEGAAVGNSSLEDTASALAGAWMTQIDGAKNLDKVMGVLNATIGAGNMRMDDLNLALGTGLLPAAKAAGLNIKDVGAALATMTDENMHADAAATRLRMSFSLLAAPSGAAEKWLKKIGLRGIDLGHAMQGPKGLISALGLLKSHLEKVRDPAKRMQILSHAFGGGRSSAAIELLLNNLDRVKKKYNQITDTAGNYGKAVEKTHETAAYKVGAALSSIEADAIQMGGILLPIFVGIMDKLAAMVGAFAGLPHGVQKGIIVFLLFAAAVGPVLKVIGSFITLAGYAAKAIEGIGVALEFASANPIVLILAGLVALGAAIVILWKKSETFRRIVKGVWNAVKTIVLDAIIAIVGYYELWLQGLSKILHVAGKMPGPLGKPFRVAADAVDSAIGKIDDFQAKLNGLKPKTVHVNAVVTGLGYVAALQEHLSMIHSVNATATVSGHRASGGPVVQGHSYLVGEKGPEVVTFGRSGYVHPHDSMAGGRHGHGMHGGMAGLRIVGKLDVATGQLDGIVVDEIEDEDNFRAQTARMHR